MILAAQLLLSLSILIGLHEFGHFIAARMFKTRVNKFYLFFDFLFPFPSLLKFSLFKIKRGDTEYGIGWFPLGGYVSIAGMIDETEDGSTLPAEPQPWEFRSKPAWQRLIIMIGGVVVNVIVGIVIFSLVMFAWGKDVLPVENVANGVHVDRVLAEYGFRDGDKILALDGHHFSDFNDINKRLILDDPREVTVERYGEQLTLKLPEDVGQLMVDSGVRKVFTPRFPCVVDTVLPGMPAREAGLLKGDSIVGVNNFYSPYFHDIQKEIFKHVNEEVRLHIFRDDSARVVIIPVTEDGVGFGPILKISEFFEVDTLHYGFGQAWAAGLHEAWETVTDYSSQLRFLFSRSGATQVGGFATFAKIFPPEWDWWAFWLRTAFISLVLAFMNILPIPALDGGHVMFLLWEMITGKAASQRVLEKAQIIGMVILLGLMLYGNGMDIIRGITG